MSSKQNSTCASYVETIRNIDDSAERARIEKVASDLERMSFEPIFLLPVKNFLRMDKEDVLRQAEETCRMSPEDIDAFEIKHREDPETIKEEQLHMLLRNYKLLVRLRRDEAEAWDEIHELYEDD